MIQIELPCCDAIVDLPPDASTVRCEGCAIEHLLAADARPGRSADVPGPRVAALAT
jgi:hypothetical protein